MMKYKNISRMQKKRQRQDDRMQRMRGFPGKLLAQARNPVAGAADRSQFVLIHPVDPVHPVRKVFSGESVANSGLDGISAHRGLAWRPFAVRLQFSIVWKQLTQLVDFQDSFRYFHMLLIEHLVLLPGKTQRNRLFPPEFGVTPLEI
jgi:hypothetical protein